MGRPSQALAMQSLMSSTWSGGSLRDSKGGGGGTGMITVDDESFKQYIQRERDQAAIRRLRGQANKLASKLSQTRSAWPLPVDKALDGTSSNQASRRSVPVRVARCPSEGEPVRVTLNWLSDSGNASGKQRFENISNEYGKATFAERHYRREEETQGEKFVWNPRQVLKVDDRIDLNPGSDLPMEARKRIKKKIEPIEPEVIDEEGGFGGNRVLRQLALNVARQSQKEYAAKNAPEPLDLETAIARYDAWMAKRIAKGKV